MLRKIHLHGALGATYGTTFELDVTTAGEAIRALAANFPAFMHDLREGAWHVVRGDTPDTGFDLDETAIGKFRLGKGDLHIVPFVAGSKRGGLLKVILGAVLVASAFIFTGGTITAALGASGTFLGTIHGTQLALFGAAMAISGVSQLLTPEEKTKNDNDQSFTMSGPGTTYEQGNPIPLVYGEVITGGVMISGGVDVERIAVSGNGGGSVGGGKK